MDQNIKKLYRSDTNKTLAGVLGGLAEYTNTDPTLWRIGFVALVLVTGVVPGVIAYLLAILIIPKKVN